MPPPDAKDYALSRAEILTEGYKGLLAVHGGAIAAMLAFASQTSIRTQAMLQAVFIAVFIFSAGLALALLIPYFRYFNSKSAEDRGPTIPRKKTVSWFAYTSCQFLSIIAFFVGTVIVSHAGYVGAAAAIAVVHSTP